MPTPIRTTTLLAACLLMQPASTLHAQPAPPDWPAANAPGQALAPGVPTSVESCVSGARIAFARGDLQVMLADDERRAVHAQLMQRYPAAARVGVEPTHLVLWRQPGGAWVYVALLQHPRQPQQWCFTASFVAGGIERTAVLLRKYFGLDAA